MCWCLVGKLLSDKPADFEALRNVIAALWRPGKGMFVKELDINRYLFQFFHEVDIQRAIEGSPWTFNKIPLVIERLKYGENPRTLALNTMEIWVQVYDLKVGFMSEKVLKAIGNYIGKYSSSCPKNFTGVWREYLRVRVLINVDKPLKRGMKIYRNKEEGFWVNFKYERVPTFCFIRGVIGHSDRFCHKLFEETEDSIVKPYGVFMKAPDRRINKQIGARWLRDNMAQPLADSFQGTVTDNNEQRNKRKEKPKITDTIMIKSGIQGGGLRSEIRGRIEDSGKSGNLNYWCGKQIMPVTEVVELNNEDSVIFIDNKKRRVQEKKKWTGPIKKWTRLCLFKI